MVKFPAAILVVDEDLDTRRVIASLLTDAGYQVTTAAGFRQAALVLARDHPDLLITELRLGAFNGLQLVIRNRARHPASATVILTNFPDPVLAAYAARADATVLVKPVADAELLRVVAQKVGSAVERRRVSRTPIQHPIEVMVATQRATLVDLSHAGFQLEMAGATTLSVFALEVPVVQLLVQATAIWTHRLAPSETCRCGATVTETDPATRDAWREFVDAVRSVGPS